MAQRAIISSFTMQGSVESGQLVKFVSDGICRVINSVSDMPFGVALANAKAGELVGVVLFGTGYLVTTHFGDSVQFAQPGDPVYSRGDGWITMAPAAGTYWKVGMCCQLPGEAWFERGQKLRMIISTPILEVVS